MKFGGTVAHRAMLGASLAISIAGGWLWPSAGMHAHATGESRTLSIFNIHTKETMTVTYKKDGRYDSEAMQRLNVFMRDWRKNESREMDPELIDHIWTWLVCGLFQPDPIPMSVLVVMTRSTAE